MDDADELLGWALKEGFELAGVCDAQEPPRWETYRQWVEDGMGDGMDYLAAHSETKRHPNNLLNGCRSLLMVGLNYNQRVEHFSGEPRIARYALGDDYHKVLKRKLNDIGKLVEAKWPGTRWRAVVDSAPLLEREFAQLAGLGWIGKNTMLIDSMRGSWFVLGALLVDRWFRPSDPANGGCGTCRACIDACPTGAIVNHRGQWQVDSRRCLSYWTIERKGPLPPEVIPMLQDWTFGCDICQEVCPFNQPRAHQPLRATETKEPRFANRRKWPELRELAIIDPEDWDRHSQGSPVRRIGLKGLRENASANLENARRSMPEVREDFQ